tara:strand:+ start:505 stop:1314 length:810 start_codon:yes stop_codon:yes gene_type:complete
MTIFFINGIDMTIIDIINKHSPVEGDRVRLHCPFCGGRDTLTISKIDGKILWNCYKASCNTKGAREYSRSKSEIKSFLQKNYHHNIYYPDFQIPGQFTNFSENPRVINYLRKNHCMRAINKKLAKVMYDPQQDRVVFMVEYDGATHDAIGRSLSKTVIPKWYRYGKSNKLFTCGDNNVAILVEDVASACAVSHVATGVALMGTHMKDADLSVLKKFKEVKICLDPDATRKSLDLQKYLAYIVKCSILRIEDDLKYYRAEEIRQLVLNSN